MPAGEPEHLFELALTSDEARQLKWKVARPSRCWVRAADSRRLLGSVAGAQPPRQDAPVKAAGLLIRLILELPPQRLAQQMELRQRALAAARERVDPHQLAVRALVQWLINERLLECRECRGGFACLLVQAGEIDEQGEMALVQRLPARRSPLVVTIFGEQLAGVQVDRLPISLDARRALGLRRSRLELLDVDSEPLTGEGEDIVNERDPRRTVLSTRVQSAARDENHLAQVVGRGLGSRSGHSASITCSRCSVCPGVSASSLTTLRAFRSRQAASSAPSHSRRRESRREGRSGAPIPIALTYASRDTLRRQRRCGKRS